MCVDECVCICVQIYLYMDVCRCVCIQLYQNTQIGVYECVDMDCVYSDVYMKVSICRHVYECVGVQTCVWM